MLIHSSMFLAVFSFLQAPVRGGSPGRFTFISREFWDGCSSQGRKEDRSPARNGRPFPGRGSSCWERGRCGWGQEGLLLLQLTFPMPALLHLLARTMRSLLHCSCPPGSSSSCGFPSTRFPPWPHFICHKGQGWEEQSIPQAEEGEQRFLLGHRMRNCPPMSFPLFLLLTCHQGYNGAN